MKRLSLLLLSLLLLLSACAAKPAPAAPSSAPPAKGAAPADLSPYQMTVLYPGDITPRMESFLAGEFNQRMTDELNLTVSVSYSPWGEYFNKLDLMLSSGEPIDWHWDGASSFGKHLSKKHCIALDDLLSAYGADVTRMIPKENWRATTSGGSIMAIPSQAMPQGDKFYTILARTDLMAEVGVKDFHTLEEFETTMEQLSAKRSDITMLSGPILQSLIRWYSPDDHIRIQNYVYVIENEEGSQAYSIFENKELMRSINQKMAEWVEKGWVPEKVLTERQNNVTRFDNGNYAFMDGAILRPQERLPSVRKNAPDALLREFSLGDQPRYKELASNEFLYITPQCADPARVMMFFNWIYQSQDHFLFTLYGVEGKDFTLNQDGSIERLSKDDLWYDWMFNNIQYAKFSSDVNPDFIEDLAHWEDNTTLSKFYGFTFDNTPVKSEVAQIDTIWTNKVYPLLDGFVDFDANYDAILAELKAAGIDRYTEEFTRQLTQYRSGQ
jgi:putative aldouronate transport system substrate-binding protein